MGIDCKCWLPYYVEIRDVADVIGACMGLEKQKKNLDDEAWYSHVDGVFFESFSSLPSCVNIVWKQPNGKCRNVLYHFEPGGGKGRLIMPRSTTFWIAVCIRLVDFFGGEVDFNDCDYTDVDYAKPHRPLKEVCPVDDLPWQEFQQRKWDIPPLTQAELDAADKFASYH